MEANISIRPLKTDDINSIHTIASWYQLEWETPIETTIKRLSDLESSDILFQLLLYVDNELAATGNLSTEVNIYNIHPNMRVFNPWISMLYTSEKFRKRGLGRHLLEAIEKGAKNAAYEQIYLYTFTAESLYKRNGWQVIDRVPYKGHETAVMVKAL